MTAQKKLVARLVGAVIVAFAASQVLTWMLHSRITQREMLRVFDRAFNDIEVGIRERVDARMLRQAMAARDRIYEMRQEAWWNDPNESSRRLRALADELAVDEVCVANENGLLTHSARREEVGALDFCKAEGQAREFARLLDTDYELAQPLLPNSLRGDMVKYVGVWFPEGGFVQVGGRGQCIANLSRTAVTGLTHGRHVSGDDGGIVITTANGTIISHPDATYEGGQWQEPGPDMFCAKRVIEGFPVYITVPRRTAIVERRVLVATGAFLNAVALILAAFLVGFVIARYVRSQLSAQHAKELSLATDIQDNAIPRTFPPFPDETRVDIFGDMLAAKEVGGDFYDFYFTGPRNVTFLVADVSGKGVGAALFMMRAKTTIKSIAQTGKPVDEVVREANDALSRDNGASMFVTAWIGQLDLATGVVTCVNAGHTPPVLIRRGNAEYIKGASGLPLGAMEGVPYRSSEVRLEPEDSIYLYTDGITEQCDASGELFGEKRLLDAVKTVPHVFTQDRRSPLPAAILKCVRSFAAGVEQADDCTQLVVQWKSSKS